MLAVEPVLPAVVGLIAAPVVLVEALLAVVILLPEPLLVEQAG